MEVYTSEDPVHWPIPSSLLCFGNSNSRELGVAQDLLCVPTLRQTPLVYTGWSFPQTAQEKKVQNVQREAYIPSKALPLQRNLVPREEFRSPRSLGPLLHPCPQSHGLCLLLSILSNLRSPHVSNYPAMRTLRWNQGSPTSLLAKYRHIQPGQYLANKRLAWCLQLDPCFLRILPGLPGDMADKMGNPSKGRVPYSSSCKTLCSVKGSYSWENG